MRTIIFYFLIIVMISADDKNIPPATNYPPVPDEIKTADYHDYTGCKLIRVEPDGVVISHKLGVAKLLFISMPPEFQKAYGYNPIAAAKAQEARAAHDAEVTASEQLKKASEEIANHPVDLIGTVIKTGEGFCLVQCLGWNSYYPNGTITLGDYRLFHKDDKTLHDLAMQQGGICYFVTKKNYTIDQFLNFPVYAAGIKIDGQGNRYSRFSDDPKTAINLISKLN